MPVVRGKDISVLFSADDIAARNHAIAEAIKASKLDNPLVISVLKGSFVFAADLIRALHAVGLSPEVDFISISSYGSGTEAGEPVVLRDVETDVKGRDLLLIDDILESGGTLTFARNLMFERGANRVEIAVLLDKTMRRKSAISAEFVGFECPDKFVVGYGMDVGHAFRELPYVGEVVGDA
ncbi:MAG: hypoxanthine phosphoribosyltransferase [Pseudomonadota bacterium]